MNILIVDDEVNILRTTSVALQTMGHEVLTAENISYARKQIESHQVDAIFLDRMLGHEDGLDLLDQLRADEVQIPVIVFTAHSSIESAVESMRHGAYDYIQKPFVPAEIRQMLAKLEKSLATEAKLKDLEDEVKAARPDVLLESKEPEMQQVLSVALKGAQSEANMLLLGPSGTGKTMLAKEIHKNSRRSSARFVTVNCPSLSKELLESDLFGHLKGAFTGATKDTWGKVSAARGGTLFLDEIGEMPLEIQPKLLRLLQDREFERVGDTKTHKADVRVIAATNRDLAEEVRKGTFREDLFYRLNVISVQLPKLFDRPSDIIPIVERCIQFSADQLGVEMKQLSDAATQAFVDYAWPGNIRELRNVVERAMILSDGAEIELDDLPAEMNNGSAEDTSARPGLFMSLEEMENIHIRRIIAKTDSLEEAAKVLGIDPATLYRKRKKIGLS